MKKMSIGLLVSIMLLSFGFVRVNSETEIINDTLENEYFDILVEEYNNETVVSESEGYVVIREGTEVYTIIDEEKVLIARVEMTDIDFEEPRISTYSTDNWNPMYRANYNVYPSAQLFWGKALLSALIGAVIPGKPLVSAFYGMIAGAIIDKVGDAIYGTLPDVIYFARWQHEWRGCPLYVKYVSLFAFTESSRTAKSLIASQSLGGVTNFEGVKNSPANPTGCKALGY